MTAGRSLQAEVVMRKTGAFRIPRFTVPDERHHPPI